MATQPGPGDGWLSLTWDDLERWAGARSVERGRTYQRGGRVQRLGLSAAGELLATVRGTMTYATTVSVSRQGPSFDSACTCPVGISCKHAVAVIAEYLDAVAKGRAVPEARDDDSRWDEVEYEGGHYDRFEDEYEEDYEDEFDDPPPRRPARPVPSKRTEATDAEIEEHVRAKSHGELADLVVSFTRRFPEIRREFRERVALLSGDVARLVAETRREIRSTTAAPGWDDYGGTPDYRPLRHRFERLLELGHPDEVVSLGREFMREGQRQVEMSHDEGETATAFGETLPVIFQAVVKSKLSGPERLLFAIDAELDDQFDTIGEAADVVFDVRWTKADWSNVADSLLKRLTPTARAKGEDSFTRGYERDRLTGWIGKALANAGRGSEVEEMYVNEAVVTRSYERLVRYFGERRRDDEAARWAVEGIAATATSEPGTAAQLARHLNELATKRKQWDVAAAHAAYHFFSGPSEHTFGELVRAAAKAGVEADVRAAALRFLETGAMPYRLNTANASAKSPPAKPSTAVRKASEPPRVVPPSRMNIDADWPLPVPDYLVPLLERRDSFDRRPHSHLHVLLDLAITAKNPAEVLKWYDAMRAKPRQLGDSYIATGYADRVAKAVADTHPERALDIYTTALNAHLPHASPNHYEAADGYLKKLKPIFAGLNRAAEWDTLLAGIREKYRNRPKFMEQLDRLTGRKTTIIEGAKKGKR